MNLFDSLFSSEEMLTEQVMREIAGCFGEDSPFVVACDRSGNYRCSDEHLFESVGCGQDFLLRLAVRVEDGDEPVISQFDDCSIVAGRLSSEQIDCGTVFLFLPGYCPESTMANLGLIEAMLNQMAVIATLIEKNNKIHHKNLKSMNSNQQSVKV